MTKDIRLETFKKDILKVCEKHNIFISHEDHQGGFLIVDNPSKKFKDILSKWFNEADWRKEE